MHAILWAPACAACVAVTARLDPQHRIADWRAGCAPLWGPRRPPASGARRQGPPRAAAHPAPGIVRACAPAAWMASRPCCVSLLLSWQRCTALYVHRPRAGHGLLGGSGARAGRGPRAPVAEGGEGGAGGGAPSPPPRPAASWVLALRPGRAAVCAAARAARLSAQRAHVPSRHSAHLRGRTFVARAAPCAGSATGLLRCACAPGAAAPHWGSARPACAETLVVALLLRGPELRAAARGSLAQCPAAWAQAVPPQTLFLGPDKTGRARWGRPPAPQWCAVKGMSPGQRSPKRKQRIRGRSWSLCRVSGGASASGAQARVVRVEDLRRFGMQEICFQSFSRSAGIRGDWHS